MSKKVFCLYLVALALVPLSLLAAEPASSPDPSVPTCGTKLIDQTDPDLARKLATMTLVPVSPVSVTRQTSGVKTTSKISRGQFVAYDSDGNAVAISVSCTLTCTGSACLQRGCEVLGNGCSSWNCGADCTGTCTQKSSTDPLPTQDVQK